MRLCVRACRPCVTGWLLQTLALRHPVGAHQRQRRARFGRGGRSLLGDGLGQAYAATGVAAARGQLTREGEGEAKGTQLPWRVNEGDD